MYVSITEAKIRLEELIGRAIKGEEIIICRRGKPVARLVAIAKPPVNPHDRKRSRKR